MVPRWWPSQCHSSDHHGTRMVAIVVPWRRWLVWYQGGGHCGATAVTTMVPRWWPSRCRGSSHTATIPLALPSPQSVTGTFCPAHEDSALVSCGLDRGRFLLSDVPFPGSTPVLLKRPSFCPAKRLGERPELPLPAELRGRGVAAGVAVLLRASTGRILLTRRASTLSIFPNIWVPPGGHVEPGEELLAVGLRELEEETGLRLPAGTFSWGTLGLWEVTPCSAGGAQHPWVGGGTGLRCVPPPHCCPWGWGVAPGSPRAPPVSPQSLYPPMLSRGLPRRHHVVTYLLLRSDEPHAQLEARMRPNESEVSAYAWLEPPVLAAIAATGDEVKGLGGVPSALPATISITELSGGSASSTRLPTATLLATAPARGEDVERVSTGTKFALGLCLGSQGRP
ncbi:nucleoside diphosphate-linked moiety X motif 17 isoform X2 [Nyctibius grandis]|uniref:nucleoside diphosphate-linked moiety X motif 17 isoform X2 n=1 Tax=Nyctibius grandis TaxID=48427 RepID=UPI0035BBAABA